MDQLTRLLLSTLVVLAAGVGVLACLPPPVDGPSVVYLVLGTCSLLAGVVGVLHQRPAQRTGWLLVLAGFGCWVAGDVAWAVEDAAGITYFPSPSDAVYIVGYALLAAGLLRNIRSRREALGSAALLDASIVTVAIGLLLVVFVIAPIAVDDSLSMSARVVASAYPLGDLLLLALVARMWARPCSRTTSYRLLVSALVVTTFGDLAWNVLVMANGDSAATFSTEICWLAGFVLCAAAACHPSMRDLAEPGPPPPTDVASRGRLVGLTSSVLLPGLVLLADGLLADAVMWPLIGLGSLLLTGLVAARMLGLVHVVQAQSARLTQLARSDALTGAPNRRTWDHAISRACENARSGHSPFSVALLDLDRFKSFNDRFGHQAGDQLLKEAVAAWTSTLGDGGMLARYGGEEFAVLLPGKGMAEAANRVDELRLVVPRGQTVSAGVATWAPGIEPGELLELADRALYAAKRAGRDRVVAHVDAAAPPHTADPMPLTA